MQSYSIDDHRAAQQGLFRKLFFQVDNSSLIVFRIIFVLRPNTFKIVRSYNIQLFALTSFTTIPLIPSFSESMPDTVTCSPAYFFVSS